MGMASFRALLVPGCLVWPFRGAWSEGERGGEMGRRQWEKVQPSCPCARCRHRGQLAHWSSASGANGCWEFPHSRADGLVSCARTGLTGQRYRTPVSARTVCAPFRPVWTANRWPSKSPRAAQPSQPRGSAGACALCLVRRPAYPGVAVQAVAAAPWLRQCGCTHQPWAQTACVGRMAQRRPSLGPFADAASRWTADSRRSRRRAPTTRILAG